MRRSIWSNGAKPKTVKPDHTFSQFTLDQAISFPLIRDRADTLGDVIIDQKGKTVYKCDQQHLAGWVRLLVLPEQIDSLMIEVNKLI
jgi:hypothetical protein